MQEARGASEHEMRRAEKASNHRAFPALALVVTERVEWACKPRYRWNGWRNGGGLVEEFEADQRLLSALVVTGRAEARRDLP